MPQLWGIQYRNSYTLLVMQEMYVVLIRTHNLSARLIHLGMFLWAILRFKKPKYIYNHVEIVYRDKKGNLMTVGAVSPTVRIMKWEDYVEEHEGRFFKYKAYEIFPQRFTLHSSKFRNARILALNFLMTQLGKKYEYANFFYHAVRIFTGKWYGSRTTRRQYCLELAIRTINKSPLINLPVFISPYEFQEFLDKKTLSTPLTCLE